MTEISKEDSLIEYPCDFPIKVMSINHPEIIDILVPIILEHDPSFDHETIEVRESSKGNYVGLTVTVYVESREQLDNIYRALHGHELVKAVL
ncbi:hypothetical protein AAEX37_00282 [Oligella sp. MSHR50489EDL]|uniref:HP0495 family protein n=1 Tax=Oligella sp. MSHR50489EDL TaxID=3139409 RepID=UPI003D812966